VAALDLVVHLRDVSGGVCVPMAARMAAIFGVWILRRALLPGGAKRLSNRLGDRHPLYLGRPLNSFHLTDSSR
jgi:hypothetical protein